VNSRKIAENLEKRHKKSSSVIEKSEIKPPKYNKKSEENLIKNSINRKIQLIHKYEKPKFSKIQPEPIKIKFVPKIENQNIDPTRIEIIKKLNKYLSTKYQNLAANNNPEILENCIF